jgi:hypothetical protein
VKWSSASAKELYHHKPEARYDDELLTPRKKDAGYKKIVFDAHERMNDMKSSDSLLNVAKFKNPQKD